MPKKRKKPKQDPGEEIVTGPPDSSSETSESDYVDSCTAEEKATEKYAPYRVTDYSRRYPEDAVAGYPSVKPAPDEGVISVDVSRDVLVDSMTDMSETPIPPDIIASVETTNENEDENGRLTLAYERLYEVPKTIVERFSDHIKYLDISHNKITNLDSLVYFKGLTSLIADDNPITENCCLPPLPKLELLWLNRCKISSLYPWVGKLKESCPNLQYLSLMGNPAAPSYFNGGTFYEYLQYRLFVISQFPSLNHLDDRRVTEDQRLESQRLYKRPFFERIAKPAGLSHIVNSSATWNNFQNKITTLLGKDKQGNRNLLI